jgi:thiamine biosynthesis lipoprotein
MTSESQGNRREFLQGKAGARALAQLAEDALGPAGGSLEPPDAAGGTYLVAWRRRAMACEFALYLNAGQYANGAQAALATLDRIDELESQLTVYRDTSEVMNVNRLAGQAPVVVEDGLFQLLNLAEEIRRETGGAYDVTAGPLVKAWGFHRRQGSIPDTETLVQTLKLVGGGMELDPVMKTVRLARPGMELNLASIGKGYALDQAGRVLADYGVAEYLIHGGRSSVAGRGSKASSGDAGAGWTVGVGHPLVAGRPLAEIQLVDECLSTTGSGEQFFRHGGKRYGHVLDPRTGWPVEWVYSCTVVAPTASLAEALSTAFYVMGREGAIDFCRKRPEVGFLMFCQTDDGRPEVVSHRLSRLRWVEE